MQYSETANYIEFHHETSSLIVGDVRSRTKGQILLLSNREPRSIGEHKKLDVECARVIFALFLSLY